MTSALVSSCHGSTPCRAAVGSAWCRLCQLSPIERSEEHTSELQSRQYLVCRLLLEKKKTKESCTSANAIRYRTSEKRRRHAMDTTGEILTRTQTTTQVTLTHSCASRLSNNYKREPT